MIVLTFMYLFVGCLVGSAITYGKSVVSDRTVVRVNLIFLLVSLLANSQLGITILGRRLFNAEVGGFLGGLISCLYVVMFMVLIFVLARMSFYLGIITFDTMQEFSASFKVGDGKFVKVSEEESRTSNKLSCLLFILSINLVCSTLVGIGLIPDEFLVDFILLGLFSIYLSHRYIKKHGLDGLASIDVRDRYDSLSSGS